MSVKILTLPRIRAIIGKKSNKYAKFTENHRNIIYYSKMQQKYIKIFKHPLSAEQSELLLHLFEQSDFREQFVPNLTSLIGADNDNKDNDKQPLIIGYVMTRGRLLNNTDLIKYSKDPKVRKMWKNAMTEYGFYYNDFKASNLIKSVKYGRPSKVGIRGNRMVGLIDLESIVPIRFLLRELSEKEMQKRSANIKEKIRLFDLKWYYDHVYKLRDVLSHCSCSPEIHLG